MNRGSKPILWAVALVILSATGAADLQAQSRGPSTADERNRAVQAAKQLRTDPLAASTQTEREWLIKWLIEVPDIAVQLCGGILGDLGDTNQSAYPGTLLATMMASEAAYVIENPQRAKDRRAMFRAGVDGALDAYEVIRKKDASYQAKKLDEFVLARNAGKLDDVLNSALKASKCK